MRSSWLLVAVAALAPVSAAAACNIVNGKAYGDCQGVAVREGAKAALNVRSNVTESAIVAGATVHSGGALYLTGISNGDIVVRHGGRLTVTGVVNGTVRNQGGAVAIEGIVQHLASSGGVAMVGGNVGAFSGTGPATFKKGSVLAGAPLESTKHVPAQRDQ